MDKNLRQELNLALTAKLSTKSGVQDLQRQRSKLCDQKYRHGTSEWAKCMRWRPKGR